MGGGLWGTLNTDRSPSMRGLVGLSLVRLWRSNHHTVATKAANSESAIPAATLEERMEDCVLTLKYLLKGHCVKITPI